MGFVVAGGGIWAGYNWPQYSVHRGYLHTMLYEVLLERAGPDSVETGWAATSIINEERCGRVFDDINDIIPVEELAAHAEKYKMTAGFAISETNASPQTITL